MTVQMRQERPAEVPPTAARPVSGFRPDLEGLRAVAVVLVVLDHVLHWPTGGFVGVDVFFVLSGFLITGLLLKEYERTKRISLRSFYARRVKRILPAATLVIGVTTAASSVIFVGARLHQTIGDSLYTLFFAANWRFVIIGQDYFAADRALSPFQHYWSLAVEEQFYILWPPLLIAVLAVCHRRSRQSRERAMIVVFGSVALASFGWSMMETTASPTTAYFSTFSRAWELAVGGLLAVIATRVPQMRPALRLAIGAVGLTVIVGGAIVINPQVAFPGPWALVPVVGTLLVIGAGVGARQEDLNPILTAGPMRYIGRISFSLYLWHWPVIIFLGLLLPPGQLLFASTAVLLSTALSVASFHGVENPIRHSRWLRRGEGARRGHTGQASWTSSRLRLIKLGVLAGLLPITAVASLQALSYTWPDEPQHEGQLVARAPSPGDSPAGPAARAEDESDDLPTQITMALEARDWPEFVISMDDLEDAKASEWADDQCIDVTSADLQRCTYDGPADRTVMVLGDSVAVSWIPALRSGLAKEGYQVTSVTMGQCPAAHVAVEDNIQSEGFSKRCSDFHEWAEQVVDEQNPDVVVLSSAENSLRRLSSGATGEAQMAEWETGTALAIKAVAAADRHVVVLSPPPEGINLQGCITRFNGPSACTSTIGELWLGQRRAEGTAAAEFSVQYIDTAGWFCRSDGVCPAFVEDLPIRADGNHLTDAYATRLGPVVRDAVLQGLGDETPRRP